MRSKAVFVERKEKKQVEQCDLSEFLLLYKQSVLLALKEQGTLDEMQLQYCMEKVSYEKVIGTSKKL